MAEFLEHSVVLRGLRRGAAWVSRQAQQSALLCRRPLRPERPFGGCGRLHPLEGWIGGMRKSAIFGWIYHYWGNFCAGGIGQLGALFAPLFLIAAAQQLAAGNPFFAAVAAVLAAAAGLLLLVKSSVCDWLQGSLPARLCLKWAGSPQGEAKKSIYIYLALCGAAGGAACWLGGPILGAGAAAAAAIAPMLAAIPAFWVMLLLFGLLPVVGTTFCWALSVLAVVTFFFGRAFAGLKGKPIDRWDFLFALFPILCAVSTVFSMAPSDSAKVSVMWLGLYACIFLVRRLVDCRKRLLQLLGALAAGSAVSGVIGIGQYLLGATGAAAWLDSSLFNEVKMRVFSTFANPNVYGEFLLFAIPLIAAAALYTEQRRYRLILWGIDLLLAVNLLLTYSRGCYVGLALTALVFLWKYSKKWLAVIAVVGLPLAAMAMPASIVERILSIGNMSDSSTSYRMMIYIGTFYMLLHYWLGGVGIGESAFNTIYPIYSLPAVITPHSHSLFMQMMVSFGIFGLIYLAMILIGYQRKIRRADAAAPKRDRLLLIGFGSVLAGVFVQSCFDYTWYNYRVFQLFWLVLALGLALAELILNEKKEEEMENV